MDKVLVPVDFWTSTPAVLAVAVELARAFGAELVVLHVWDFPGRAYPGMQMSTAEHVLAPVRAFAQAELDAVIARVRPELPRVRAELRCGDAAGEILATIAEEKPDVVVIGTHGRRGFQRAILGSVAEKVVRRAEAPVLAVPIPRDDRPLET